MAGISFDDLAHRLTTEAKALLREMVSAHLEAGAGDRIFIESNTWGNGCVLILSVRGFRRNITDVDGGAIDDLLRYGVLNGVYEGRNRGLRVGSDAIRFHEYLLEREGEAVDHVEAEVRRVVEGSAFAAAHPGAARALGEAFTLLWTGRTDDHTISEIGDHLRKALFDLTSDLVGDDGGKQEKPIDRLDGWLKGRGDLADRERTVLVALVALAAATLDLDHRLNHVRDESDKGRTPIRWEEIRRAAFVTAAVCYELGRSS